MEKVQLCENSTAHSWTMNQKRNQKRHQQTSWNRQN